MAIQSPAPAIAAAIGNQIPLVAAPPAAGLVAPIKAGSLRGLALANEKRLPLLPDVPTYQELGYSGLIASAWTGFFAAARMAFAASRIMRGWPRVVGL